jgi:hypothetical protein
VLELHFQPARPSCYHSTFLNRSLFFFIPSEAEGLSELSNGQLLIEKASRSL